MNERPAAVSPPIDEIRALIEQSERVLVASHIDPDGDAIGSQLAFAAFLRDQGKDVVLVRDTEVPDKYRFLAGIDWIRHVDEYPADLAIDTAVILECPTIERSGVAARFLHNDLRIINIDHHYESGDFGTTNWIDPTKSSVGEMLYELFEALGYRIPPEVAEQLFTAIVTDTGRFRFPATSPRTMEIAGQLIAAGADPKKITDNVYFRLSASTMKLTGQVLASIEYHEGETICLLTLTKQMLRDAQADISESDGLVDFALFCETVEVGALLKEYDGEHTRVSMRSRGEINVAALAARYGGGGHFNASGCTMPFGLAEARRELIKLLSNARREKQSKRV